MSDLIKQCRCENAYQDSLYGKNMRVHTPGKDVRCTVCGTPSGGAAPKKK